MNRPSSSPTRTCEPMHAEAVIMLNWCRPAPSTDHCTESPNSLSAVVFMCAMCSTSGPMPPITPMIVCRKIGGSTRPS